MIGMGSQSLILVYREKKRMKQIMVVGGEGR